MQRKSFVAMCLISLALADGKLHPVRKEIVEEIKLKATSWKPKEVHENHLRHVPADKMHLRFGHLGSTPFSKGAEVMTKITKGAISVFDQVTSAMGLKGSVFEHKLREETDANPESEETSKLPEESTTASGVPINFSWRTEYPECLGPIEDQGECGACWAFSSGGLLADRFCIHSKGAITTRLSP